MGKYKRPDKRYPENWNRLRHVIFTRDHYRCQMCGKKLDRSSKSRIPVCHHIVPVGYGGSHAFSNLETLCSRCHRFVHRKYLAKKKKQKVKK